MNDARESELSVSDEDERKRLIVPLIAYLQGDGWISKRRGSTRSMYRYDISFFPDCIVVAKHIVDLYRRLYGRTLTIVHLHNHYLIRTSHHRAYEELAVAGPYKSLEWRVPFSLLDTLEKRRDWLRAFFDCEAYVGKSTTVVQSVNKKGIEEIRSLLGTFSILSRTYQYERRQLTWNTNHILIIGRRESRQLFLREIGFNHIRKQDKLRDLLNTCQRNKIFK
jgi:hypothetical protein